ncbi:MAG TPA: DUF1365 family protein, partial [Candidatus Acidoferrum sp.]|nr:DUF1365 family protein [Candidatus Acidoferrum sp.]
FNPLTLYFCYRNQQLFALVYEVHNTFGERHFYVLPNKNGRGPVHQSCKKAFFVSPFLDMDLAYSFSLVHSERHVSLSIRATRNQTPVLLACLAASKRTFSDANLLRAALRIPLAPFQVIAAIHFEALRLWLKGVPGR